MNDGNVDTNRDTIVAIATGNVRSAIGIVRISGPDAKVIAQKICKKPLSSRQAKYCKFYNEQEEVIDSGVAIWFQKPASFTGEDIVELQAHGSPTALQLLLDQCLLNGARMARPGEFSERAYLNGKIDLVQAEAIADLIDSQTVQAVKSAGRSLQGGFSESINALLEQLISLRVFIEGSLDFPDEELDLLTDGKVTQRLKQLLKALESIIESAQHAAILNHGVRVAIVGSPNVGKSTLINQLTGKDVAIVTEVAGTTRDRIEAMIDIDGIPVTLVDTAGIRDSNDIVEQQGVKKSQQEIQQCDLVLFLYDVQQNKQKKNELDQIKEMIRQQTVIKVANKTDLLPSMPDQTVGQEVFISAQNGQGLEDLLKTISRHIRSVEFSENTSMARSRHVDALRRCQQCLLAANEQLQQTKACELLAEELKEAQSCLSEITGEYLPDDLLGDIFSRFCIGK